MVRNFCSQKGAVAGKETFISKAHATVRRANTRKARKENTDIFCSNFARSRTPVWSVIQMPASPHYYERFRRRGPRSLLIHSPPCTQSLASWNFRDIDAPRLPTFPD